MQNWETLWSSTIETKKNGFIPPNIIPPNGKLRRKLTYDVDDNEVENNKRRQIIANVDNNTNENNNKGTQNIVAFGTNVHPKQIIISHKKNLSCCELIESLIKQGLSFLSFSISLYYYNKKHNEKRLDTRVLLSELLNNIKANNYNYNNNNKIINKTEILYKFVIEQGLINFQFYRLMQKAQKHEIEFVEFIFENKLEMPDHIDSYMSKLFTQNVKKLCNQDIALLILIEIHMMNVYDNWDNKLSNLYFEVIDKIKNTIAEYDDLFCEEENTLCLLGYSAELSNKRSLYCIIQKVYSIINNH